jgi:uroporphyrinogen-III synthase
MAGRLRDPQRGRELPRRPRPETGAPETDDPGSVAVGAAADAGHSAAADRGHSATADAGHSAAADGARTGAGPVDGASDVADPVAVGLATPRATATPSSASAVEQGVPADQPSPGASGSTAPEVTAAGDVSAAVGPLAGRTVLLPRSPERAAALAERLRAEGATVLVSPAIERAPIEDTTAMDAAVADLADGAFAWVVVTSVNAIDELSASAARRGLSLAELSERARARGHAGSDNRGEASGDSPGAGTRWAAVGPATRRALEAVGVRVDLEAAVNSARGLLAAFDALAATSEAAGTSTSTRVLVPQGDLAKPTMSEGLRERGWDVRVVTAYRTVAHELAPGVGEAWRAGVIDVVVLTSGSVAREVASQLGAHAGVAGVAIGEPTAQAAQEVWLRVDAVAVQATDDALAEAVLRVAAELSEAHRGIPRVSSDNESPLVGPAPGDQPSEAHRAIPRPSSDNESTTERRSLP